MSLTPKAKAPPHYRKRHAGHHRHSKGYSRVYWPYLPMLLIVLGGVFVNSLLSEHQAVLGWQTSFSPATLLSLTNLDRTQYHEKVLSVNNDLAQAAQAKASSLVKNNYWSHISPTGETPAEMISSSGYQFISAGENLAYGFNSAISVNSAWMASPSHRANILNSSFSNVGFAVAESANFMNHGPAVIVVAEYGQPNNRAIISNQVVKTPTNQSINLANQLTDSTAFWPTFILAIIIVLVAGIVIIKHLKAIKKWLTESEDFVVSHPLIDILLVLIATIASILIHRQGSIS